jgi:flagellin
MGLRVNTNIAALSAQRNLASVSGRLSGNFSRLSSGLRIATAADDAAGLGISERMRGQIRSLAVASRNAQDGVSLAQTAEGALQEVNNNLNRMRELAVQAANGTLTTQDRQTLDTEFQALITEIGRVSGQATFNGVALLDGSTTSLDIQVGTNANETISDAGNVMTVIDGAIDLVTEARGELGAAQNRLTSSIASILNTRENLSAAESRIRDVDVAIETADLTRNSILQQAAVSILAQANTQPQLALSLLQG